MFNSAYFTDTCQLQALLLLVVFRVCLGSRADLHSIIKAQTAKTSVSVSVPAGGATTVILNSSHVARQKTAVATSANVWNVGDTTEERVGWRGGSLPEGPPMLAFIDIGRPGRSSLSEVDNALHATRSKKKRQLPTKRGTSRQSSRRRKQIIFLACAVAGALMLALGVYWLFMRLKRTQKEHKMLCQKEATLNFVDTFVEKNCQEKLRRMLLEIEVIVPRLQTPIQFYSVAFFSHVFSGTTTPAYMAVVTAGGSGMPNCGSHPNVKVRRVIASLKLWCNAKLAVFEKLEAYKQAGQPIDSVPLLRIAKVELMAKLDASQDRHPPPKTCICVTYRQDDFKEGDCMREFRFEVASQDVAEDWSHALRELILVLRRSTAA